MTSDPTAMQDPRTKYRNAALPEQEQSDQPGLTGATDPSPDHGEQSWVGRGRLQGRRMLITGGDSGIGRATAIAFAREGADVAIAHLPEEEQDAQDTAALVREAGRICATYPVDITVEADATDIVRRTVEDLGGIDVLILNAAYQRARTGIDSVPTEEVRKVFETNLVAQIVTTREAVPHMKPGASIIVTTSIQAVGPKPELFDYAMSKAAQVAFIESMAAELAEKGIRVNGVAPGPIWTPLIPATGFDGVAEFGQDTPLGRPGQPAELAGAYVYLASEEASYVSGSVIPVTGGKGF
ncbi:SDR family oxidoreductase [Nesterenkonia halotolerans]|uniref:NAD(P)-dependent dehydrogenase (Short-subunit alcohol dehydrogenase family) n=1 Tax=Nesterenkonia halotolerans TaxID=225325 RepID=A0ABR9J405_9MICC|nr:SDR family oxidoreductase [Nesterenkonia halotolerans]MBE1513567.1 NAD(P)-dependent dehydrogenase (short-subunit alcohol dehydrogenase family) [Nesterenkonia halotolerans]